MKSIIIISLIINILTVNLSKDSTILIKKYNPLQLEAYLPAFGEWKIGYGTTNSDYSVTKTKIVPGLKINKETAEKWLKQSLKKNYVPKIKKYDKIYKWKQNQFDALLSYVYDNNSMEILTSNGKKKKEDIAKSLLMYSKIPIISHDDKIKVMKKTNFWDLDYFGGFLIEVFIALLHPNILTKGIKFKTKPSWFGYETEYEVNDIFCILTLLRVYVIFRYAISVTIFYNYRALRLARTLGIDMSRIFAVKCYILYEPFKFLTVFGSILIMLLSFAIKVTETPIYTVDMGLNDYRSIINCIWNVLVTMTTAGYGDMYPQTGLGKFIIVFVSLLGSIVVSLLTVSLQDLFGFAYYEESAFNSKHNNIINNSINEKAGKLFLRSMMYHVALKKAKNKNMKNKDRKKYYKMSQEYLDDKRDSEKIFQETIQFNRNTYQILSESELLGQRLDYFLDGLNKICVELYKNIKALGRVALRAEGTTMAVGFVEAFL